MSDIKILKIQDAYIGHRIFEEDIKEDLFVVKTDLIEEQIQDLIDGAVKTLRVEMGKDEYCVYDILEELDKRDDIEVIKMAQVINIITDI